MSDLKEYTREDVQFHGEHPNHNPQAISDRISVGPYWYILTELMAPTVSLGGMTTVQMTNQHGTDVSLVLDFLPGLDREGVIIKIVIPHANAQMAKEALSKAGLTVEGETIILANAEESETEEQGPTPTTDSADDEEDETDPKEEL